MKPEVLSRLAQRFPSILCLQENEDLVPYSFDGTAILKAMPGAVVFPTATEEVADLVRFCSEYRIPLVTRGSGTGLSGGSVPVEDCLILCLSRMDHILEVDGKNLTLLAEAGVITASVA